MFDDISKNFANYLVSGDINKVFGEFLRKGTNLWQSAAADDKYSPVWRVEILPWTTSTSGTCAPREGIACFAGIIMYCI